MKPHGCEGAVRAAPARKNTSQLTTCGLDARNQESLERKGFCGARDLDQGTMTIVIFRGTGVNAGADEDIAEPLVHIRKELE